MSGRPSAGPPFAAVFFDFAGTLFSDRALRDVHLLQLRFIAEAIGSSASDDELRAAYRSGMARAYREVASAPKYLHRTLFGAAFRETAVALGGAIDGETVTEAVDRQYLATVAAARVRPDGIDTLAALRSASLHVQLVSNIDDEQLEPLIDQLGLRDMIDAATSSESAGSCKPDPLIYHAALDKAGCPPAQVLFVGDSLTHDIEGPAAVGMRTAWLVADAKPGQTGGARPDFVIDSLSEVLEIVGARGDVR